MRGHPQVKVHPEEEIACERPSVTMQDAKRSAPPGSAAVAAGQSVRRLREGSGVGVRSCPGVRKFRIVKSRVQKGRFKVQGQGAEVHKLFKSCLTCGPWAVPNRCGAQSGKVVVSLKKSKVFGDLGGRPEAPKEGAETPRAQLWARRSTPKVIGA